MERTATVRPLYGPPVSAARRDWTPRLSAVVIEVDGDAWRFRLTERCTVLELALLRHHFPGLVVREVTDGGIVAEPVAGTAAPTREELAAKFAAGFGR